LPLDCFNQNQQRCIHINAAFLQCLSLRPREYENDLENLTDEEKSLLESSKQFYEVTVENKGGLVMPLIFKLS